MSGFGTNLVHQDILSYVALGDSFTEGIHSFRTPQRAIDTYFNLFT